MYHLKIRHLFKKKKLDILIFMFTNLTPLFDQFTTKAICFKIVFPLPHLTILLITRYVLLKGKK